MKPNPWSFTYEGGELDLRRRPDHKSRETSGVWVFGDRTWKIFPNMTQWDRVEYAYKVAAEASGLPVPSCQLYRGIITDSRKRTEKGFALAATHITQPARFFALKKGTKAVKRLIAPVTDDDILSKMERAFSAAMKMGLRDPQGFIDPRDPNQPIVFIDLHTSSTVAPSLEDMYKYVRGKRATLL